MNTQQKHNLTEFTKLLLEAKDAQAMESVLSALLTPSELRDIPNRLQIMRMLKQGVSQREISKKLGVGIATVTRGSKQLQSDTKSEL
ncbi:trp operon repressor [Marinicellulosiphila megalodicopiae]|uniref:trp operon repressor n=1 Tax=Marinicellulosiphila megalodicopiae TaxID=2724896 RepID=UPI003BAF80A9